MLYSCTHVATVGVKGLNGLTALKLIGIRSIGSEFTGCRLRVIMRQIANSLPSKDQLALLCTGIVRHIDNRDQKFSSILPSLRTLMLLMSHDYGFYYVKQSVLFAAYITV